MTREIRLSSVLAVMGVLALLFAMLMMPALACGCKRATKANACLSNVKQQGLGLIQYADDHDDRFAPRDLWMDGIAPYAKEERVFHDPEAPAEVYGYSFNAALDRTDVPEAPEKTPMTYDSVDPIRNASDLLASLPRPGRHAGQNHVAYADGHAKRLRKGARP